MLEPALYQGKTLLEYLTLIDDQAEEAQQHQRSELNKNSNNNLTQIQIQQQHIINNPPSPSTTTTTTTSLPPDNYPWFIEEKSLDSPRQEEKNDIVLLPDDNNNPTNLMHLNNNNINNQLNQPLPHTIPFQSPVFVSPSTSPQTEEIEHLKKSVDLLTVRVNSLHEIITIQEKELVHLKKSGVPKEQWSSNVTKKWREKVLQLLVERGANDLTKVEEQKKQNAIMEKIEEEKKEILTKFSVKERMVQDIEAELDLKKSEEKSMKGAISRLSSLSSHLSQQNQVVSSSLRGMYGLVNTFCTNWSKKISKLQNGTSRFEEYCMRAHYMLGRLQMVQSMLSGRELRWRNTIQQLAEENRTLRGSQQPGIYDANTSNSNDLRVKEREIQRLMAEREFFVKRQQEDSLLLSHRIQEAKDQFQVELAKKEAELDAVRAELQIRLSSSSQEIRKTVILEQEIESLREELHNSQMEVKNLQKTLMEDKRKVTSETQDVISRALQSIERERDKISEELNAVKREYAQSVIRGKQVERELNLVREREKREDQEKMDALQENLRVRDAQISRLKKERNLLLNVIKGKENAGDPMLANLNENTVDEEPNNKSLHKPTNSQNTSPSISLESPVILPETTHALHSLTLREPAKYTNNTNTLTFSSSTQTPITISQQFPFSPISNIKHIEENHPIENQTLHEPYNQHTQKDTTTSPILTHSPNTSTQKISPYWQKLDSLANMTETLLEEEEGGINE